MEVRRRRKVLQKRRLIKSGEEKLQSFVSFPHLRRALHTGINLNSLNGRDPRRGRGARGRAGGRLPKSVNEIWKTIAPVIFKMADGGTGRNSCPSFFGGRNWNSVWRHTRRESEHPEVSAPRAAGWRRFSEPEQLPENFKVATVAGRQWRLLPGAGARTRARAAPGIKRRPDPEPFATSSAQHVSRYFYSAGAFVSANYLFYCFFFYIKTMNIKITVPTWIFKTQTPTLLVSTVLSFWFLLIAPTGCSNMK